MTKDTFWCISYKGMFIRGHRENRKEVITVLDHNYKVYPVKSLHAGKILITKIITEKVRPCPTSPSCNNATKI